MSSSAPERSLEQRIQAVQALSARIRIEREAERPAAASVRDARQSARPVPGLDDVAERPDYHAIVDRWRERATARNIAREADADRQRITESCLRRITEEAGVPVDILAGVKAPRIDTDAWAGMSACLDAQAPLAALCGPVGRGKSLAALLGARHTLAARADPTTGQIAGQALVWRHVTQLVRLGRFGADAEELRMIETAPALVLDDLGTEAGSSDYVREILDAVIYQRHGHRRWTAITYNGTPDEFVARYGERIASRMADIGRYVLCTGDDLRRAEHRPQATATGGGNTQPSLSELYGSGRLTIDHLGDIE